MKRLLLIALVLASCSKAKKDAAPATSAEPPKPTTSTQDGSGPDRNQEALRNQGGLGVSAPTESFDPLPEGSGGDKGTGPVDRKVKPREEPQPVSGGAPAFVTTIETVTVDGKPAPAEITQTVKVANAEIQVCYDKGRATSTKGADIVGSLKIAFSVLATGAVSGAVIEGKSLGQFELENCVMGVLMKMKVAKPPANKVNAVVTISFTKK